jgi:hypothetical protein
MGKVIAYFICGSGVSFDEVPSMSDRDCYFRESGVHHVFRRTVSLCIGGINGENSLRAS